MANCRRAFSRAPPAPYGRFVVVGSSALTCSNLVELTAIEPLTFSMRTSQLGRLQLSTALATEDCRSSKGWGRWRQLTAAGTTADVLRTVRVARSETERERRREPFEARLKSLRRSPHPLAGWNLGVPVDSLGGDDAAR
jgi:hypothetical protein